MNKCVLCGATAVINTQDSASRTIYNCPNCGVFVISDLVSDEVEADKAKIASFFTSRNLSGRYSKDIVFITSERAAIEKSYVHMSVRQIVSEFPESISERMELSLRNLVNKSEYPGYEIKIESLRLAPVFYLEKINFESMAFALTCLEKRGFVTLNHYGASSSFFPCGIVVTLEGWDFIYCASRSTAVCNSVFLSLCAGKSYTEKYSRAVGDSCKICGYRVEKPFMIDGESVIDHSLMANIRKSRFVICDLSDGSPLAYYITGVAKSLNKTVILTCRAGDRKKLRLDTNHINVLFWDEDDALSDFFDNAIRALVV